MGGKGRHCHRRGRRSALGRIEPFANKAAIGGSILASQISAARCIRSRPGARRVCPPCRRRIAAARLRAGCRMRRAQISLNSSALPPRPRASPATPRASPRPRADGRRSASRIKAMAAGGGPGRVDLVGGTAEVEAPQCCRDLLRRLHRLPSPRIPTPACRIS
jgi:hypothetical protein